MEEAIETLRRVELFEHLSAEQLELLARHSRDVSFAKHAVLMSEGEVGESMYVLTAGSVKVFVGDGEGRELVLHHLEPGSVLGDIALLDDAPRSASAAALEKSAALAIGKEAFLECLRDSPEMGINIIRFLTARLRLATEGSRSLALDNVYRRLADKLRELAVEESDGRGGRITVLPKRRSHQELGNLIGASREMVGKVMAELVKGEYVKLHDGRIALLRRLPKNW